MLTSRGQKSRAQDPSSQALGIAGEHLVPAEPPVRILNRVGIHAPTIAVPANIHCAEGAINADVEDVGVAVIQQNAGFAILLALHEREELGEGGFGLVAKFS